MNHQNPINYPPSSSSSSSYYNYYQSDFQNPNIPNPQFDHSTSATTASAPPDPSMYSSPDYYYYSSNSYPNDLHNPTAHCSHSSNPIYDPNPIPSWYHHQNQNQSQSLSQNQTLIRFDDYGRPISAVDGGNNEQMLKNDNIDQSVYGNVRKDRVQFDDYGRPLNHGTGSRSEPMASLDGDNVSKPAAKVEAKEDWSGVQKFRVILLSEGGGGDTDVLCQIGLDGIQILDPATSRTLKVYSLETVTNWEVLDSNIFAFWTKSSVDINARRVRLKSNSYTTTKILDMVAAASFQLKEMDGVTVSEQQPAEKKKGFPDWINLMKPANEEKDHWVPDEASTKCTACSTYFGAFVRRHHCRNCGDIFCDKCTQGRIALTAEENAQQVRVCDQCLAEVTQRLSHVNEVAGRSSGFNRHEDLAKKLQEEMEKKRKTTAELKTNMPHQQMKEVECPTCTVHLQVEVPASGSKTIECSVCQHPFLVHGH